MSRPILKIVRKTLPFIDNNYVNSSQPNGGHAEAGTGPATELAGEFAGTATNNKKIPG
jgi:hypothetical protein